MNKNLAPTVTYGYTLQYFTIKQSLLWTYSDAPKIWTTNEGRWEVGKLKLWTGLPEVWSQTCLLIGGRGTGRGTRGTGDNQVKHLVAWLTITCTHLMLGEWWTARYLGSGEDEGFVSIDLGTVMTGLEISCFVSPAETLSAAGPGRRADVTVPELLLIAVLGSLPETVTVVTTPPAQEAGKAGASSGTEESVLFWPWVVGMYVLSTADCETVSATGPTSVSIAFSETSSLAGSAAGVGAELSYFGGTSGFDFDSTFLTGATDFIFLAGTSSSDAEIWPINLFQKLLITI